MNMDKVLIVVAIMIGSFILISILSLFLYTRNVVTAIPNNYGECLLKYESISEYVNGVFETGGKHLGNYYGQELAEEDPFLKYVYANPEYIQVCQYYVKRSSFIPKLPILFDSSLEKNGKKFFSTLHYTDWFTRYSVYRYENPNYIIPQNYNDCVKLNKTKENYECSLEILERYIANDTFSQSNPYIKQIDSIKDFFHSYEGNSSKIVYYPITYYPCDFNLSCYNKNHICHGGYDNFCSSPCNTDEDCPQNMHCWRSTNKKTGELVSTCQKGENPFK